MDTGGSSGTVVAVSASAQHGFSKAPRDAINLLAGLGVEGDAHCGVTTQHLYRVGKDPTAPNLAQVHFLPIELFAEMAELGFVLAPGAMGENVLTEGHRPRDAADRHDLRDRRCGGRRNLRHPRPVQEDRRAGDRA